MDSQVLETDSTIFIEAVFSAGPPTEGSVVINEINYNSSDEYNAEDWIEIYNNSESMIDISNWIIKDDNDDHRFQISPDIGTSNAFLAKEAVEEIEEEE